MPLPFQEYFIVLFPFVTKPEIFKNCCQMCSISVNLRPLQSADASVVYIYCQKSA